MRLTDLLKNLHYSGKADEREILGIAHDSRKVKPGTLFIAIKGQKTDGYEYIPNAIKNGASAIIANGRQIDIDHIPIIHVSNTRKAMSKISANFYGSPSKNMKIVGITGTNGKTTVCKLIDHMMNKNDIRCGSLGTFGFSNPSGMISTGFTTPESVDLQQMLNTLKSANINYAVMEI